MATFYPHRPLLRAPLRRPGLPGQRRLSAATARLDRGPAAALPRADLAIGEYYNVSGFKCLPICFMHTMANDIPYYYKTGRRHFDYMHVTTGHWGNKALTNYQMARQLWDVETDCEALWEDYFAPRYGPAAGIMRRFYESLEQMLCNARELKYGLARRLERGDKDLFPNSHLRYRPRAGRGVRRSHADGNHRPLENLPAAAARGVEHGSCPNGFAAGLRRTSGRSRMANKRRRTMMSVLRLSNWDEQAGWTKLAAISPRPNASPSCCGRTSSPPP